MFCLRRIIASVNRRNVEMSELNFGEDLMAVKYNQNAELQNGGLTWAEKQENGLKRTFRPDVKSASL